MNRVEKIAHKLRKAPLPKQQFLEYIKELFKYPKDAHLLYDTLIARGFPLIEKEDRVYLKTALISYKEQEFVIVDIETNGSKPESSQVIEIGAIKFQGSKIIDRFESFIYASEIPEYISKLTGITSVDLFDAPSQKEVLFEFKKFLGNAVFVAHNVSFDYNYLSSKLEELGFDRLANRKLCSIDLARKTIESQRYGLEFLNETLGINTVVSHRAYADALTAYKIFQLSLKNVPEEVKTTEELIEFSKKGKNLTISNKEEECQK